MAKNFFEKTWTTTPTAVTKWVTSGIEWSIKQNTIIGTRDAKIYHWNVDTLSKDFVVSLRSESPEDDLHDLIDTNVHRRKRVKTDPTEIVHFADDNWVKMWRKPLFLLQWNQGSTMGKRVPFTQLVNDDDQIYIVGDSNEHVLPAFLIGQHLFIGNPETKEMEWFTTARNPIVSCYYSERNHTCVCITRAQSHLNAEAHRQGGKCTTVKSVKTPIYEDREIRFFLHGFAAALDVDTLILSTLFDSSTHVAFLLSGRRALTYFNGPNGLTWEIIDDDKHTLWTGSYRGTWKHFLLTEDERPIVVSEQSLILFT